MHAQESSICKAAIFDRAMPLSGGVIGVAVTDGLTAYEGGKTYLGVKASSKKDSAKSFFTYKVDNIDLAEKDLRLVTSDGYISYRGRLELRVNGEWGTVCEKGLTPSVAKVVCRSLGYTEGTLKNELDSETAQKGSRERRFDLKIYKKH